MCALVVSECICCGIVVLVTNDCISCGMCACVVVLSIRIGTFVVDREPSLGRVIGYGQF